MVGVGYQMRDISIKASKFRDKSDHVRDHIRSVTEPASLKKTHVSFTQNKEWHPTIGKI